MENRFFHVIQVRPRMHSIQPFWKGHCPPAIPSNHIGFNCNVLTMTPAHQKSTVNNMTRRARQRGDVIVVIALLATSGVGKSDSDSSCSVLDRSLDLWPRSCWYCWWWCCCLCWWWCWSWCWDLSGPRWCRSRAGLFAIVRWICDLDDADIVSEWWWCCCLHWCWCWDLCGPRWCRSRADPFSIVGRIRDLDRAA